METQKQVVLTTLNARYIHASFGLRYLKANLGSYESDCQIEEFTLESRPSDVVERLLTFNPRIIGIGVYIWNVRQSEQVVALLKKVAPHVCIVIGGPEVSYEHEGQRLTQLADYVITGWGEVSFRELVANLSCGNETPKDKIINGIQPPLKNLSFPYQYYSAEDIEHRVLYVEASRGCPFKCEFCLSALDKTAWPFDLDAFLAQMDELYQRGARHFKFVDRTFNLKIKHSIRILEFFLERLTDDLFLHFELIPDHLPERLKDLIARFPKNSLQFEIGIQTFNPEVQTRIGRKQDNQSAKQNIKWILERSQAHVHADLIFGLPGETLESFADSFDQLVELRPHEVQVGILKRLKGSPIIRHTEDYEMVFNPEPPFNILSSSEFNFAQQQRMTRFARFWDLIGNSGRFRSTLPLLLADEPFNRFMALSERLYAASGQTHKISLPRLIDLIAEVGAHDQLQQESLVGALHDDFSRSGLKSIPRSLRTTTSDQSDRPNQPRRAVRQARH